MPQNMEPLQTPDITLMQKLVGAISALIVAAIACVNAFGWSEIDLIESSALIGLWTALGAVLVIADAVIRNGRARAFLNQPKGMAASEPVRSYSLPGEVGVVEETRPGYSGEQVVLREDVASGIEREDDFPQA